MDNYKKWKEKNEPELMQFYADIYSFNEFCKLIYENK